MSPDVPPFRYWSMRSSQLHSYKYCVTSNNLCLSSIASCLLWWECKISCSLFVNITGFSLMHSPQGFVIAYVNITSLPRSPYPPNSGTHLQLCAWTIPTRRLFRGKLCCLNHSLTHRPVWPTHTAPQWWGLAYTTPSRHAVNLFLGRFFCFDCFFQIVWAFPALWTQLWQFVVQKKSTYY